MTCGNEDTVEEKSRSQSVDIFAKRKSMLEGNSKNNMNKNSGFSIPSLHYA